MTYAVMADRTRDPVDVTLLGAVREVFDTSDMTNPVQQLHGQSLATSAQLDGDRLPLWANLAAVHYWIKGKMAFMWGVRN